METLARSANRGSVSTGGYDIDNSLKMESDNTEYVTRTNSSASNSKTFTFSGWYKFTELKSLDSNALYEATGGGPLKHFSIYTYNYKIGFYDYLGGVDYGKRAAQVCRDTSAWYHIVVTIDTTESVASDRSKFYINGVRVTEFDNDHGDFPLNFDTQVNKVNIANRIGRTEHQNGEYLNGYVAEVHMVDGQALAPTDFGEFDADTGIWKPIQTNISSYGTNGFYLKFDNASDLGEDAAGGSSFTLNNITSADQATDTPTNNFCTQSAVATFLNRTPQTRHAADGGSASQDDSVSNAWTGAVGTVALFKGKWYWELQGQISTNSMSGIHSFVGDTGSSTLSPHQSDNSFFVVHNNGSNVSALGKTIDGTTTYPISTGNEFTHQSIVGIALDLDNSLMTYYINGGSAGTNLTNIDISDITDKGDPVIPFVAIYRYRIRTNFGGYVETAWGTGETDANGYGNFKYSVPSGYYAICSKNLAEFG